METCTSNILQVTSLSLSFDLNDEQKSVVRNVSFSIGKGKILALIGESGSGKTLVAKSIMGLQPKGCSITHGTILFNEINLSDLSEHHIRQMRGKDMGFILQEPMVSLNPSITIGEQMTEGLILHRGLSKSDADSAALSMLERVGVNQPEKRLNQYPHEFSGGMRQRIMIAAVMLLKPKLVIADEPTTALDASIQADVMQLLLSLTNEINASVLLITHDLSVVADYADQVVVMEKGEIVESNSASALFDAPQHQYTRNLLSALPRYEKRPEKEFKQACIARIEKVSVDYCEPTFFPWQKDKIFKAVKSASLTIHPGEVVALVGESGSGKSTLGRTLVGMKAPSSGRVLLEGKQLYASTKEGINVYPDIVQLVFQDPYSSLNPKLTIKDIVLEGLINFSSDTRLRLRKVTEILADVDLDETYLERYPHQLSGGQRQRICIARALISDPKLVIADEPVSALDLTVQAKVLELLKELQKKRHFSMLFISHDLAVVQQLADTVVVMEKGIIVERGTTSAVFENTHHPYTQKLLEASPYLEASQAAGGYKLMKRHAVPKYLPSGFDYGKCNNMSANQINYLDVSPHHQVLVTAQES